MKTSRTVLPATACRAASAPSEPIRRITSQLAERERADPAWRDRVDGSPRMVAQRLRVEAAFGRTAIPVAHPDQALQRVAARDRVDTLSAEISSSAPGRSAHRHVLDQVLGSLDGYGIPYKVGGSAAARLLGARRRPNDLELEMPDMARVSTGHGAVNEVAVALGIPHPYTPIGNPVFGVQIRLDGTIHNDTTNVDERVAFEIDMMDENADQMNAQLEKPAVMDVFSGDASREIDKVVERSRLIVNYADRSYNKQDVARTKEDYHQIHDLLAAGNRDAILQEASHHGHARTNFSIPDLIRGQYKVSEFVASAELNGWFRQGAVLPTHVNSAHVRIAQDKQWLGNDNRVNTRYMQAGW